MAKNYVANGEVLQVTAGSDISSGDFVLVGTIGGVAITDIANGAVGSVQISGVFTVNKAADTVTQGAKLYWDAGNSELTTTAMSNTLVGVAASAATGAEGFVDLLLNVATTNA